MLDMGFIPDIERICEMIPFTRQTLFFSATMPPEITKLTEKFLHAPVRVEVSKAASTGTNITQRLVKSGPKPWDKRETLRNLIKAEADGLKNAIIFCNRKVEVSDLYKSLREIRVRRRRAAWRHGPARAHGDAGEFPLRQAEAARRLRRRRARPRHSRRQPRLQFRRADPCRGLCPPHRPHRPRRTVGQGLHHRHPLRHEISRRDRAAHRAENRMA